VSRYRGQRSVYVQATVNGKRKWLNIGFINRKGKFFPGNDIALIGWGFEE
jgi:hypothetical protein